MIGAAFSPRLFCRLLGIWHRSSAASESGSVSPSPASPAQHWNPRPPGTEIQVPMSGCVWGGPEEGLFSRGPQATERCSVSTDMWLSLSGPRSQPARTRILAHSSGRPQGAQSRLRCLPQSSTRERAPSEAPDPVPLHAHFPPAPWQLAAGISCVRVTAGQRLRTGEVGAERRYAGLRGL